jgi:hypothetical protein
LGEKNPQFPSIGVQSEKGALVNDRPHPKPLLGFKPLMKYLGFGPHKFQCAAWLQNYRIGKLPGKTAGSRQANPNHELGFGVKWPYWDLWDSRSPTDREIDRKMKIGICAANPNR